MKKLILYLLSVASLSAMERTSTVPELKTLAALNFIKTQTKRKINVATNPLPIPEADLAEILKESVYWLVALAINKPITITLKNKIISTAISPDGTQAILGLENRGTALIDINNRKFTSWLGFPPGDPEDYKNMVRAVKISPDGTKFAIGYNFSAAFIGNLITGQQIAFSNNHDYVSSVDFSPDGTKVLVLTRDRGNIIDATTGALISTFTGKWMDIGAFSPDSTKVLIAPVLAPIVIDPELGRVKIIDVATGNSSTLFEEQDKENSITSAHFSSNGAKIVVTLKDGKINIIDAITGSLSTALHFDKQVSTAKFSPDSTKLVSVSNDGTVRIINAATYSLLTTVKLNCDLLSKKYRFSASFSRNGKYIIIDCRSHAVIIETATGKIVGATIPDPNTPTSFVQFSPDTKKVFVCSGNTLKIYYFPKISDKDIIRIAQKYLEVSTSHQQPSKRPRTE